MGLQSPQLPAPEELSLVPWPNSTWPHSLLKTKPWLLQFIPSEVTDLPSPGIPVHELFQ